MPNYTGKEYIIDTAAVRFDTTISTFNRIQDKQEYLKTKASIEAIGQDNPIIMDNGLCIDGRHRVKALTELGIDTVKCVDINPNLSIADKLLICNKDTTSGRHLTKAQLAIQAFEYTKIANCTKQEAAEHFGVRTQELSYVNNIITFLPNAYKELKTNGTATIDNKKTKSLEIVNRYINAIRAEHEVEVETTGIDIDYNTAICTEKGKELFWEIYTEDRRPDSVLADHLVRYVNLRYKSNT